MSKSHCASCGSIFEENRMVYGGSDYCPSCNEDEGPRIRNAVDRARKQFSKLPKQGGSADLRAHEFVHKLEKERARNHPGRRR